MSETTFIYFLKEPDGTGDIRYVGKTSNPKHRLAQHISQAKRSCRTHRDKWIQALLKKGQQPILEVFSEVPVSLWKFWEVSVIWIFRQGGYRLTNSADGGECGPSTLGKKLPPRSAAHSAALSLSLKGKVPSQQCREAQRAAITGKRFSLARRLQLNKAHRGRQRLPDGSFVYPSDFLGV